MSYVFTIEDLLIGGGISYRFTLLYNLHLRPVFILLVPCRQLMATHLVRYDGVPATKLQKLQARRPLLFSTVSVWGLAKADGFCGYALLRDNLVASLRNMSIPYSF